jgi:hypothetical protein
MSPTVSACLKNCRYETKAEALRVLRLSRREGKQHPYHCLFCRSWHLGHQRRRGRR